MHVNILSYTSGARAILGTAQVVNGVVRFTGRIPPLLMDTFNEGLGSPSGLVYPFDGESFLHAMPTAISGSYIRAELVP